MFFIHSGSDVEEMAEKIKLCIIKQRPFIGLHCAGIQNVSTGQTIIDEVTPEFLEEHEYYLEHVSPRSTSSIPTYNVTILQIS